MGARRIPTIPPRRFSRALTLAEVAMAMFIIGVGVLSIATVYLQRERAATLTAQQQLAHRLADGMARTVESQRNPDVRFENAIGVRCAPNLRQVATVNAQTKSINDVACWQQSVAAELPSGAGSIAFDESVVPPHYAITVSWLQPRGGLASYTVRVAVERDDNTTAPVNIANADRKPNAVRAVN